MSKYKLIKIQREIYKISDYDRKITIKEVLGLFNSIEEAKKYISNYEYYEDYEEYNYDIEYILEDYDNE